METMKKYDVETAKSRFEIEITKDNNNEFIAKYYGSTPKFAKIMEPGDELPIIREVGSGTLKGNDEDKLLEECKKVIEELDGEIISIRDC